MLAAPCSMTSRNSNYELAILTASVEEQVFRVCDVWGLQRPKVHVAYSFERLAYMVSLVFAMRWEVNWLLEEEDLPPVLYDTYAEQWAQDSRYPLSIAENEYGIHE